MACKLWRRHVNQDGGVRPEAAGAGGRIWIHEGPYTSGPFFPRDSGPLVGHGVADWECSSIFIAIQTKLMNQALQFAAISVVVDDLQGNSYPARRQEFNSSLGEALKSLVKWIAENPDVLQ